MRGAGLEHLFKLNGMAPSNRVGPVRYPVCRGLVADVLEVRLGLTLPPGVLASTAQGSGPRDVTHLVRKTAPHDSGASADSKENKRPTNAGAGPAPARDCKAREQPRAKAAVSHKNRAGFAGAPASATPGWPGAGGKATADMRPGQLLERFYGAQCESHHAVGAVAPRSTEATNGGVHASLVSHEPPAAAVHGVAGSERAAAAAAGHGPEQQQQQGQGQHYSGRATDGHAHMPPPGYPYYAPPSHGGLPVPANAHPPHPPAGFPHYPGAPYGPFAGYPPLPHLYGAAFPPYAPLPVPQGVREPPAEGALAYPYNLPGGSGGGGGWQHAHDAAAQHLRPHALAPPPTGGAYHQHGGGDPSAGAWAAPPPGHAQAAAEGGVDAGPGAATPRYYGLSREPSSGAVPVPERHVSGPERHESVSGAAAAAAGGPGTLPEAEAGAGCRGAGGGGDLGRWASRAGEESSLLAGAEGAEKERKEQAREALQASLREQVEDARRRKAAARERARIEDEKVRLCVCIYLWHFRVQGVGLCWSNLNRPTPA